MRMRLLLSSFLALTLLLTCLTPAAAAPPGAMDGPGALSHFDLARKDCRRQPVRRAGLRRPHDGDAAASRDPVTNVAWATSKV